MRCYRKYIEGRVDHKKTAIIILSVCWMLSLIAVAILGVSLFRERETAHQAERVWDDYLAHCDMIGCDPRYEQSIYPSYLSRADSDSFSHDYEEDDALPYASRVIRCMYNQSFDPFVPGDPPEGNDFYGSDGGYVYDLYICSDGSGYVRYQHWGSLYKEIEKDLWRQDKVQFADEIVFLTADEVSHVVAVMERHDYENLPTHNPDMYTTMDGNTTFVVYASSLIDEHAEWNGHMISADCAEEGDPCLDIRLAMEALLVAHGVEDVPGRELTE